MESVESRSFDEPDETRTPDKTTIELVGLGGGRIQRSTLLVSCTWNTTTGR
jgi:hypothetical protein